MNNPLAFCRTFLITASIAATALLSPSASAQGLRDGLVSYWPLDTVVGDKTPDIVSGYDFSVYSGGSHILTNASAIKLVPGLHGNAVSMTAANQFILAYLAGPNDALPINKNPAFTISFWVNAPANQVDTRMFSEGNLANNNPLFNIGCNASGGMADFFFRQQPSADETTAGYGTFGAGAHLLSTGLPYDNTWHNITVVQQTDGSRVLYIDGTADPVALGTKAAGNWNLNATSIGGILRSGASAWSTAMIDDVALWKRALTVAEINQVKTSGLASAFPSTANGLVAYWPMDNFVGDKMPDVVGGYDFSVYYGGGHTLTNSSTVSIVPGYKGNAVMFNGNVTSNSSLLGYIANPNDALPINKNPAFTINYWIKAPSSQVDTRIFSEGNMANNNPLFNIGCNASGGMVDLFFRQQPSADETTAGYGTFGAGAHLLTTGLPYDSNNWHQVTFVQQVDGSRVIYIDGIADPLAIPAKTNGNWNLNATSVGGILRSGAGSFSVAAIDDVALWNRALTTDEIASVRANGVPTVIGGKTPLQIKNFLPDHLTAVNGDSVVLSWEASSDATLTISPSVGDVASLTKFGVGSVLVKITNDVTFTITAVRGTESTNATATVRVLNGVAPGWRVIENFNNLSTGKVGGQAGWLNASASASGALNPAVVTNLFNNKALTFQGATILAADPLNSLTIKEGSSNTVFFRFYLSPILETFQNGFFLPDLDLNVGLTEKTIRDVPDFDAVSGNVGGGTGPAIRFYRQSMGNGGPIDIQANNGVALSAGQYSYINDNPFSPGLTTGVVYNVWMDIANKPFNVVSNVQQGGDLYSVYLQKQGDTTRTTLFINYLSDRDGNANDSVLGRAGPDLTHLFFTSDTAVSGSFYATNGVIFDDFFVSSNGFLSTIPVAVSSYLPAADILKITGSSLNKITAAFTLTWGSKVGSTYTVQKRSSLTSGSWTTVTAGYPTGGATGTSTSYTDTAASGSSTFYRISTP